MSPLNVIVTDFGVDDLEVEARVFEEAGLDIRLERSRAASPDELASEVADADALIVQFAKIDRRIISGLTRCKVISRYGIGVDMIDVEAATEVGIPVANVPDFCIDEVSTQTLGFVIDLARHTLEMVDYVRSGSWGAAPLQIQAPRRLSGQTIGIVGLGAIGRAVARKAQVFGLGVIAFDPYVSSGDQPSYVDLVDLAELLRRSDYVTLHCPLVPETRGLIGTSELAAMKPTAYLLNLARGPVVDQAALYQALTDGTIAGAALDVLEVEPPPTDEPLLQLSNVLVTPHASSWSVESLEQLRQDVARNVVDALEGRSPRSVVNRAALASTSARTTA